MDAQHLPAVIGTCVHCHQPVYELAPVSKLDPMAHVGCAVHARRR